MERLDGKRIVVTGGTSGMGEGVTRAFPQLGAKVVFWGRNEEAGARIAEESGATFVRCEVSDEHQVKDAMERSAEILGGIDVLVHAAGIAKDCPAERISFDDFRAVFETNVYGTFLTNEAVFPHMRENGGAILNFTSASAFICSPNQAHYGASKGAVNAWSRSIAKEWMPYNIRVNLIAPCIKTPMYEKHLAQMPPEVLEMTKRSLAGLCLGGDLGDMQEDFVPVMAFLASDSAKFITGQTISIDGGIMMVR